MIELEDRRLQIVHFAHTVLLDCPETFKRLIGLLVLRHITRSLCKEFNQITSLRNQSNKATYNFDQEQYHLQLLYTYFHKKKESALVPNYNEYGRYLGKIPGYILVDDKDSTFALVDLYVSPLPHHLQEKTVDGELYRADNWLLTTTSSQKEPVAYSKPFIGGTIDQAPTIEYEKDYYSSRGGDLLTDEDIVFKNAKFDGITNAQNRITNRFNLPYRLIDPYLYFAYLGKWVFIGDREISASTPSTMCP